MQERKDSWKKERRQLPHADTFAPTIRRGNVSSLPPCQTSLHPAQVHSRISPPGPREWVGEPPDPGSQSLAP